jgi:tripartite-type tricarboxylate transporter receptor subunit TctC
MLRKTVCTLWPFINRYQYDGSQSPLNQRGKRMSSNRHRLIHMVAMAVISSFAGQALAQTDSNYPWKPITLVMPYTPGSTSDFEARTYQENIPDVFKQNLLIDYRPGASGIIANSYVAKAPPDGHTIAYTASTIAILPAVRDDLPYDWMKDLQPVVQTTRRVFVMVVSPTFPARTYQEYISYARANPGKVTWSTVGAGGALHMSGEWLASANNIKLTFVHYKGSSAAEVDLLGGRIDSAPKGLISALPLIKSGKVRALAIITNKRSDFVPDLKTIEEMGVPGYNYPSWIGIVTSGRVPREIVDKLSVGFVKAISSPRAMKVWKSQGSDVVGLGPDEFRKQMLTENALWRKLVKENNIKYDAD